MFEATLTMLPNRKMKRIVIERQRDNLLGFAKVLDNKLEEIARRFQVPDYQVRHSFVTA